MRLLLAFALTGAASLTDGRGRPVGTDQPARRIASCSLAGDEILTELLQRDGHPERLIALSVTADDARNSNIAPAPANRIAGRCGGELESLLALKPDLAVLASYNRPETIDRLEHAGVRTYVMGSFASLHNIEGHVEALGKLTHTEAAATAMVAAMRSAVAAAHAKPLKRAPRVLEFYPDGTVSGDGTLFNDLVLAAGGVDAATEHGIKGWPRLSTEALAALKPDLIVASGAGSNAAAERARLLESMRRLPGWSSLAAVQAGRLIVVDQRTLGAASQYAARSVGELHAAFAAWAEAAAP